jgi:serine/threonine-protein kinase HipA
MSDEMSFYIGGELNIERMSRNTFASAAGECGLTERIALKSFDEVADSFENALKKSADHLYEMGFKDVKEMSGNILKNGGFGKL